MPHNPLYVLPPAFTHPTFLVHVVNDKKTPSIVSLYCQPEWNSINEDWEFNFYYNCPDRHVITHINVERFKCVSLTNNTKYELFSILNNTPLLTAYKPEYLRNGGLQNFKESNEFRSLYILSDYNNNNAPISTCNILQEWLNNNPNGILL